MHPMLWQGLGMRIPTYGALLALGFLLALLLLRHRAPRLGLDRERITVVAAQLTLAGTLGSRLWFVQGDAASYWERPWPVHPTQLYEAVGEGAILLVLLAVWRRRRARGEIGLAYLTLYPLLRLAIEPLRGDSERGMVGGLAGSLSVPQLASLALLAMAALLWWIMGARTTVGRPLSG